MLGIRSFFHDLSFKQHPAPGRGLENQKLKSPEPSKGLHRTYNFDFDNDAAPEALDCRNLHHLMQLSV